MASANRHWPPLLRLTLVIIVALLIPIVPFVIIGELPGDKWLSASDESALSFGLTGAALLASDLLIPVPSSVIGSLLGARLGIFSGFIWTLLGLMVGNTAGYLIGRLTLSRLNARAPSQPALIAVFLSRPVPVLAEALTISAGAARLSLSKFLIACVAGNTVYAVVLAASGSALLPQGWIGAGLVLLMALPVASWLVWRAIKSRKSSADETDGSAST